MKRGFGTLAIALLAATVGLTACKKEEGDNNALALLALLALGGASDCSGTALSGTSPATLTGNVTTNTTLGATTLLTGTVFVESGVTLTIPAGATVFGESGSSLFIRKGAKIMAEGTASKPICFTSSKAVGSRAPQDWGGIVIIGDGVMSTSGTRNTEGTSPQAYGGSASANNADNSGVMRYVRIEYAGQEVATGNELNSLSLYAVGSGTTLEYIQSHLGYDDGFEFFGGAVNAKYLLATGGPDDDFDFDESYVGKLQFLLAVKIGDVVWRTADVPGGFEMDGSPSGNSISHPSGPTMSNPTVKNFTIIGDSSSNPINGMVFREGMLGNFANGVVYGFATRNFLCEDNDGSGTNTNPTLTAVLAQSGKTNTIETECSNGSFSDTSLSSLPITSAGDSANNVMPDFTPVGAAAATAPAVAGDAFFTANTTYGGLIPGNNWIAGWTTFRRK